MRQLQPPGSDILEKPPCSIIEISYLGICIVVEFYIFWYSRDCHKNFNDDGGCVEHDALTRYIVINNVGRAQAASKSCGPPQPWKSHYEKMFEKLKHWKKQKFKKKNLLFLI